MEYRSSVRPFGLPLLHVAIGPSADGRRRRGVATGWIAIGDVAIGVVFACGGLAIGGVTLAGLALGGLSIGGLALGLFAQGGLAIAAVLAIGGAAFGWWAAVGGLAIAHDYALGGLASARNVLAPARGTPPFAAIPHPAFHASDALILVALAGLLLSIARTVQARRR